MTFNMTDSDFVVEDSFTTIKATIRGRKRWGSFAMSMFVFLVQAFCFLPVLGFVLLGLVQKYLPQMVAGIVMLGAFGLYLYILYVKFLETSGFAFDQEIVEIDDQSIIVERSGFLFLKTRRTFLADNIKGITSSFHIQEQLNFMKRLPFASSSVGAFMIWENRLFNPFYNFGNRVSREKADAFLESVYTRFPKYRYTGTT